MGGGGQGPATEIMDHEQPQAWTDVSQKLSVLEAAHVSSISPCTTRCFMFSFAANHGIMGNQSMITVHRESNAHQPTGDLC